MGRISLPDTSRARPRRPTVWIVLNGAIRRVAVATALVVVPAMIDRPLSSSAMAQEGAGSIDLNGAWQFEDVVVRVRHDGTTVRADFIEGAKCFDGQVRPYFLEGQLSGTALSGRMMACSGSPRLVQECPLSSMYETTFEVTVEAGRMAGTRVAQGIALDERNGRHTNCRLDSSYDEIRAFEGTRWCGDEERRVAEGQVDMEARAAESNALAERISATPGVGNWTEEGYSGPGADLAAEFYAMDRAMLESLERLQAAEAALERCRSGTTLQCPNPGEAQELRARANTLPEQMNAIAELMAATPSVGNWFEEGYSGPNADLAARWRAIDQEMLQIVAQLGGATEDLDLTAALQARLDTLNEETGRLEDVLNAMNTWDWTREDYIGPNADLAAQWRALDSELLDVIRRLQELEERGQLCPEDIG